MKRRYRRALEREKAKRQKRKSGPPRWVVIASLSSGAVAGFCFWYFVSRCGSEDCFFNYYPLMEIVCSLLIFYALPHVIYGSR